MHEKNKSLLFETERYLSPNRTLPNNKLSKNKVQNKTSVSKRYGKLYTARKAF